MVFFVCNGCGTSIKKNQVEKHQFQCRKSQHFSVSCVDCSIDFMGQEYKSHIKCVSEEEKYSAKGFVPKPNQNKNERKQSEWVEMVQNLVETVGNTNDDLSSALQRISQHENIPRKKPKFINFLKNVLGNRVSPRIIEQLWDLISKALDELRLRKVAAPNNTAKASEEAGKTSNEENGIKRKNDIENENPVSENKRRRKKTVESQEEEICKQVNNDTINSTDGAEQSAKVKWCKIGKIILRAQNDKELSLKKFQKKIIGEYLHQMGDAVSADESVEVLWSKCQKKLSKNKKFRIHKEKIKLVS